MVKITNSYSWRDIEVKKWSGNRKWIGSNSNTVWAKKKKEKKMPLKFKALFLMKIEWNKFFSPHCNWHVILGSLGNFISKY